MVPSKSVGSGARRATSGRAFALTGYDPEVYSRLVDEDVDVLDEGQEGVEDLKYRTRPTFLDEITGRDGQAFLSYVGAMSEGEQVRSQGGFYIRPVDQVGAVGGPRRPPSQMS